MEKDTITDLCERLHMLWLRYNVVFREPTHASPPYIPMAESLARGLLAEDKGAVVVTRSLVDLADTDRAEFWATPLGRLLFVAGGYGDETLTQSVASALLGCSRQWVHALVVKGDLDSFPVDSKPGVRRVLVDQVRPLVKAKLDRLVK